MRASLVISPIKNNILNKTANSLDVVAVAAGNDGLDYGGSSPAEAAGAFAVGASDSNDAAATFSNFGGGLGVYAPGTDVISLWNNGGTVSDHLFISIFTSSSLIQGPRTP
jgi:hypothetical protein